MRDRTHARAGLLGALAAALLALFAGLLVAPPTATAAGTASISGKVTDSAGTPLGGVRVYLYPHPSGSMVANATTDSQGRYTLSDLEAGSYSVYYNTYSSAPDFPSQYWSSSGPTTDDDALTPVTVGAGEARTGIDAALKRYPRLRGKVLDGSGVPVAGAPVIVAEKESGGYYDWRYAKRATTAADGTYDVRVDVGTHKVRFEGTVSTLAEYYDDTQVEAAATEITATLDQVVTGINATLAKAAQIQGRVVDTNGVGLAGISVSVNNPGGGPGASATTAADGTYVAGGLRAGTYEVCFSDPLRASVSRCWQDRHRYESATPVVVGAGATVSGINATLRKAGAITGRITVPAQFSVRKIEVTTFLWDAATSTWLRDGYYDDVDSAGNYSLTGLTPGEHIILFKNSWGDGPVGQYWGGAGQPTKATAQRITVASGGNITGIDTTMRAGASISGTIRSAAGMPLTEGRIASLIRTDGLENLSSGAGYAMAASDESYKLTGIAPGTYKVCFEDLDEQLLSQCWNGKSDPQFDPIVVSATDQVITGIDASLATDPTKSCYGSGVAVTGSASVGSTHTVSPGTWYPSPVSYGYQWLADGVTLAGETASTYVPKKETVGKKVSVRVTVTGYGLRDTSATSPETTPVTDGTVPTTSPSPTTSPTVSPSPTSSPTTSPTVSPTLSPTTSPTATVTPLTLVTKPKVKGKPRIGKRLKVVGGVWSRTDVKLAYRWKANGKTIKKARKRAWKVLAKYRGKRISVLVTASAPGATSVKVLLKVRRKVA